MANITRLRRWALATGTGLLMSAGAVVGMLGTGAAHGIREGEPR